MTACPRPPAALRAMIALMALAAVATVVALMLSDRAPGLLVEVFGDRVRQLWDRIDARSAGRIPADVEPDFVVHVVVWGVASCLLALAAWTWRGVVVGTVGAVAFSTLIEFGQGRFATARSVERVDVAANLFGVTVGTVAAAAVIVIGNFLMTMWRSRGAAVS